MRVVPPTGPLNSPLLALVGEAPGKEEDRTGRPFAGASGHLLDQMLMATGISRRECFITNVVNVRPPGNYFGGFYHDKKKTQPTPELTHHRIRLYREMMQVKPKMIVAFGDEAMKALVDDVSGITNHRGMIYSLKTPSAGLKVLPTFHPAYILRCYEDRPVVELDLKKALRQAYNPFEPQMRFSLKPNLDEVLDWFEQKHSPVACDIETIGVSMRTMGFAWSGTEAISIPFILSGHHAWSEEEENIILIAMDRYLRDPNIEKYFQNAPFDCTMIARELGLHVNGIVLDTMYSHHLLYPTFKKSLDFLCTVHTDFPRYWGKDKFSTDKKNAKYNCYDCCTTWIAAQNIIAELKERGMYDFYMNTIHPAVFVTTRIQNRGVLTSPTVREEVRIQQEARWEKNSKELLIWTKEEVNPNSPKQVAKLLYETWSMPKQFKGRSKTVTTKNAALEYLGRKDPMKRPALQNILECRKSRKLISTYIDTKLINERQHTSYGMTVTGRLSSSKTWDGLGGNLQNIPRGDFRRMYIPDPGKVWIRADLKQAEYMIFVWDAGVYELIDRYVNDPEFDVHTLNASKIYMVPEEAVTKKQRSLSKNGVYAGNYQVGALTLSRTYDLPLADTRKVLKRYKETRPELETWWDGIREEILTTRTIWNLMGRERIFFGRVDNKMFRDAYSHRCQSTVADILNQAMETLDSQGVELLIQVHDELDLQCNDNPETIKQTVRKVKSAMEVQINVPGIKQPLIIPAEISVGPDWFHQTEYKEVI